MIQLTFYEIYRQVQDFIQDRDPETLQIIKDAINREYERIATGRLWDELTTELNESVAYVAGEAYLALPADCAELLQISDKTVGWSVSNRSLQQVVHDNISTLDVQADVLFYAHLGHKATKRPLATEYRLEIFSENSNDKNVQVRVTGLRSAFLTHESETITTNTNNGTTPTVGTTVYRRGWSVDSISTNADTYGVISIREYVSNTIVGYIPKGQKESRFCIIRLQNPPASANALNVIYKKTVGKLVHDGDVPTIPVGSYLVERVNGVMRQYDKKYVQGNIHVQSSNDMMGSILSERKMQPNRVKQARPIRPRLWRGY